MKHGNCSWTFTVAGRGAKQSGRNVRWAMIDVLQNPKKAKNLEDRAW